MTVVNTGLPIISGTTTQGHTLSTTPGTWTFDLDYLSYAYQWLRCDAAGLNCVPISGATGHQYGLVTADVGSTLRSQVTATENSDPTPPTPGPYIDTIAELTAVFLPVYTLSANITQGVTNPAGLGGGIYEISDGAGSGFRFVCTSQMAAIWDNTAKACLAFADIRPGVGLYEQWNFKLRVPSVDNPSFSNGFFAGTMFEFGHHQLNSGVKIEIDPRPGGEGFHVGVPINFNNSGSFNYYKICDFSALQLNHDYVVDARLRYNPDNTGYVRVKVDGVTIVDQFRPMRPNTSEIPKVQFGWYSDRAAAKNGSEIRNLQYTYGESSLGVNPSTMLATAGTILREDTASQADPKPGLWGTIDAQDDSRHVHKTTGGSTHLRANGTAQGNTNYRELTLMDGDDFFGERVELGRNRREDGQNTGVATAGTFALYNEGDHKITFWSMRFGSTFDRSAAGFQNIMQMKQAQGYVANGPEDGIPVISMQCAFNSQIHLCASSPVVWSCPAPALGVWFRVAVDVVYSMDPSVGKVIVYVDTDGDGAANYISPTLNFQTIADCTVAGSGLLVGDPIPSHLRLGMYSDTSNSGTRHVDVDNVQVVG